MTYFRSFTVLAALLLAAPSANADAVTYTQDGRALFVFDAPDGWQVTKGIDISPEQMPEGLPTSPRVYSIRPPGEAGVM